jgi:hypothetical protein
MAVYLKEFENHTQYENYINSSGAILPNVSICATEEDVHYSPYVDTRVVAKFNVTDTSSPTPIGYIKYTSGFSEIEIDGVVQQSVVSAYTFDTIGEHTVKYTLKNQTSIGYKAFQNCKSLTSIDIPYVVTSIGEDAFDGCSGLTSINIPSGVTSIGGFAFNGCKNLSGSIIIPNGVTVINNGVFKGCSSVTSFTIPNAVTSIGDESFMYCSGFTSIDIPSTVTSIGVGAFQTCKSLVSVICRPTTPPTGGHSTTFAGNASGRKIYVPADSVNAYKTDSGWWSFWKNSIEAITE